MLVAAIPIQWILLWSLFVTVFYLFRYKNVEFLKSEWGLSIVFALNTVFFAWGILFFLLTEFIRHKVK